MPYKDRENQRERWKQRYREDPEFRARERARRKRWREANPGRERRNPERERESALRWSRANPERRREYNLWRNHGLRPDVIAEIWELQDGKCYLCQEPLALAEVHIDHDHRCCPRRRSCGTCRRGLAHDGCNASIGHSGDSPERLRLWAANLEAAQRVVTERLASRHEQLLLDLG